MQKKQCCEQNRRTYIRKVLREKDELLKKIGKLKENIERLKNPAQNDVQKEPTTKSEPFSEFRKENFQERQDDCQKEITRTNKYYRKRRIFGSLDDRRKRQLMYQVQRTGKPNIKEETCRRTSETCNASRRPNSEQNNNEREQIPTIKICSLTIQENEGEDIKELINFIKEKQQRDEDMEKLQRSQNPQLYASRKGILRVIEWDENGTKDKICVPKTAAWELLRRIHQLLLHFGTDKCIEFATVLNVLNRDCSR